jgi:hypothetical protein
MSLLSSSTRRAGAFAALLLSSIAFAQAQAPEPEAPPPAEAAAPVDAATWGVYATLADSTVKTVEEDRYAISVRWKERGKSIIEEWKHPLTGVVASSATIVPGDTPGSLVYTNAMGSWYGGVEPDGSVKLARKGLMKFPMQVTLVAPGKAEYRGQSLGISTTTTVRLLSAAEAEAERKANIVWPAFPSMPDIPQLPAFAAARALYQELTAESWTPAASLSGIQGAVQFADGRSVETISGKLFCEDNTGPTEINYINPWKETARWLVAFRGKGADCAASKSGSMRGIYKMANKAGSWIIIGDIGVARRELRVRATGDAVRIDADGSVFIGSVNPAPPHAYVERAVWRPNFGLAIDAGRHSLFEPSVIPSQWIYPGVGSLQVQMKAGFPLEQETAFRAGDGSYRVSGKLVHGDKPPAGTLRREGAPASYLYLTGTLRIETSVETPLGPAGKYLWAGTLQPGALPALAQPEPGTLAQHAGRFAACPYQAPVPQGWLAFSPGCESQPTRLQAWSVDGRYRITFAQGEKTLLEQFNPMLPGTVAQSWRADRFTRDRIPAVEGSGELWRGGQRVFAGNFAGLSPDGEGSCQEPGSEFPEPCSWAAGERVDAIWLARQEQAKLDGRRHADAMAKLQAEAEAKARADAAAAAAERQRQEQLRAQQAAQKSDSGFQWGKLAAMGVGALAAGIADVDAATQLDVVSRMVADSAPGAQGMNNLQGMSASRTPSASGGVSSAPAKPALQQYQMSGSCPSGTAINISIPYRTQGCLAAKKEFTRIYACNEVDDFARAHQQCSSACGHPNCDE